MWAYKLLYHLKTTVQNIREHRATVLMSLAAVGFTLLLLASYLLLLTNLQAIGERLGKELQIMLYLETGLSGKERARVQERLAAVFRTRVGPAGSVAVSVSFSFLPERVLDALVAGALAHERAEPLRHRRQRVGVSGPVRAALFTGSFGVS